MSEKQLCWGCQNAIGKCSWSRELKPVDGWVAEEHPKGRYEIYSCPQFIPDEKREISARDLQQLIGRTAESMNKLKDRQLINIVKMRGYNLTIENPKTPEGKRVYFITEIVNNRQENK